MLRIRATLMAVVLVSLPACSVEKSPRPSLVGQIVDSGSPTFSDPTAITNPLFPAATVTQVVQLGVDGGQPLRVEVTLMPDTRSIEWEGTAVEAVVVQFIAYRNRRVIEVAYDYFAQADDGSVWYFGELVDNYASGRVSNHTGAWLAGEDGPPGMIMPADPRVGDIYHPENIPGVVFEELIVLETGVTTPGPSGEITGAIRVEEHLMDGGVEQKVWAPGYGEFRAEATNELVTVAVAAPTDEVSGPIPEALGAMRTSVGLAVEAASGEDGPGLSAAVTDLRERWNAYRPDAPPLLAEELEAALTGLESSAAGVDRFATQQATIDTMLAVFDLQLQFRAPAAIDHERLAAWMRQLRLDADARDRDAVFGDAAIATVIWARAGHALEPGLSATIDALLDALRSAVDAGDLPGAAAAASEVLTAAGGLSD